MKLISWNVRGLGGADKRREVSHLVKEHQPFLLCIQDTKLPVFDAFVCKSIWGDDNVDYSYQPSVGASGYIYALGLKRGGGVVDSVLGSCARGSRSVCEVWGTFRCFQCLCSM